MAEHVVKELLRDLAGVIHESDLDDGDKIVVVGHLLTVLVSTMGYEDDENLTGIQKVARLFNSLAAAMS